jgi:hypothetical protein
MRHEGNEGEMMNVQYILIEVLSPEQAAVMDRKQVAVHYIATTKEEMQAHVAALRRYAADFQGNLVVAEYGGGE